MNTNRLFKCVFTVTMLVGAGCSAPAGEVSSSSGNAESAVASRRVLLVTAEASVANGVAKAAIATGFHDSSFDYAANGANLRTKAFCYSGDSAKICDELQAVAAASLKANEDGAHDLLELTSCSSGVQFGRTVITAAYKLSDDYGGELTATREIGPCDGAGKGTARTTSLFYAEAAANSAPDSSSIFAIAGKGFYDEIPYQGRQDVALCYSGKSSDVCAIIKDSAAAIEKSYEDGAHQMVSITSCRADATSGAVNVAYTLVDDYAGTKDVTRAIGACASY